ncbi:hypothetical protein [Actinokineospora diospyrosa]|uniref:SUKH superfamily protein n=1 Tax=Actinokineospora diospyrosa TaxID=103728 RepID=A0ABT1IBU2_9PSEU|nr:hypothetical protein [Actinokineospora diospyrosa]MCP2270095.1 hypothetical protein [Actinokineospora diospyrosa]
MTAVDDLARLVGWSSTPKMVPDWSVTERLLGFALPDDYKRLLEVLPVGEYGGTFLVQPPTVTGREGDLAALFEEVLEVLDSLDNVPYPIHPDVPGLLPWAEGLDGDVGELFWLTGDPDPNRWPVLVSDLNHMRWEQFDGGAVEVLTAFLSGRLPSEILPAEPLLPLYESLQDLPD